MQQFRKWSEVPENLKTKTQLKEMGLKPRKKDQFAAIIKFYRYGWQESKLYDVVADTIEIKKRRVVAIDESDITSENIGAALYVINTSARKSRDTKALNYQMRRHSEVQKAKNRQQSLYDLKDKVISKSLTDGIASIVGYHIQKLTRTVRYKEYYDDLDGYFDDSLNDIDLWEEDRFQRYIWKEREEIIENKLLLIDISGFTFHRPVFDVTGLIFLGEIDGKIESVKKKKTDMPFEKAKAILQHYIN